MHGIIGHATGEIATTQDRLNELLTELAHSETTVSCVCEDENYLRFMIFSKAQGTVHLRIRLIEAKHDRLATLVSFQLTERRLEGNPLKSILFAKMPDNALNFLLKLFALPPTIRVTNVGDIYTVELHEWLAKSPLAEKEIMGVRLLDCIKINGIEVETGRLVVNGRMSFGEDFRVFEKFE